MLHNSSNYQKDLKIAGNDDVEISQVQRHHFKTIGGGYFAECDLALKKPSTAVSPRSLLGLPGVASHLLIGLWATLQKYGSNQRSGGDGSGWFFFNAKAHSVKWMSSIALK